MKQIEEKAIQTYQKNLEYFEKEHKELFQQLTKFNSLLEKGNIQTKYSLEYLDGYFDIKELKSGNFLYVQNSNEVDKELAKRVNYKKNSFTFEGFPIYNYVKKREEYIDKERGKEGLFPIMKYYIEHSLRDDEMKYIAKYIFIGVGLGGHIIDIHKKITADDYLIIEDNIELFRLSLFTTEYYKLGEVSRLYFAIETDQKNFSNIFEDVLGISLHENRYLKYTHFPVHSKEKIEYIKNELSAQIFVTYGYKTMLTRDIRPLEFMNDFKIINLSKHLRNSLFTSKPTLILGAGPSLEKEIEFVRKNHNKFIIIAVSAVLKRLHQENIKPDIVFHVDGFEASLVHLEGFDVQEFVKDSIAIFHPQVPAKLRDIFTKENIFYFQTQTDYIQGFNTISTPCVGSLALVLSLIFNIERIYILGLDFAFDPITGESHSSGHKYSSKIDLNDDNNDTKMSLRGTNLEVQGNFREKVYTNALFYTSISALHKFIPFFKKDYQTIYNLNDGAFLDGSMPKRTEEIEISNILDKEAIHKIVKQSFDENSIKELTLEQIDSIEKRLKNSLKLRKMIQKYQKQTKKIVPHKFLSLFYAFILDILDMDDRESKDLSTVCNYFLRYTLPLLTDMLNSKTIKNEHKHIKFINDLVIKELFDIEKIYRKALENFLKRVKTKE